MQKLIITCNNNAHTGKTTALRGVYELLKEKGYEHKDIAGPGMGPNYDVKAIFTINGMHVGVETMGDNTSSDVHQESLKDFMQSDCVIIITAKATQEDLEEGLRAGANAYIFKPFSGKELQIRVNWILMERRMLWEKYQLANQQVSDMGKELSKDDQAFISKFTNQLCMSKSTLRRKLNDLTGESPVNYITKIRVDYAKQLLKGNPDLTINEVGMRCGFSDQAYFSRIFKQQVGVSPLQYRKNLEVIRL